MMGVYSDVISSLPFYCLHCGTVSTLNLNKLLGREYYVESFQILLLKNRIKFGNFLPTLKMKKFDRVVVVAWSPVKEKKVFHLISTIRSLNPTFGSGQNTPGVFPECTGLDPFSRHVVPFCQHALHN